MRRVVWAPDDVHAYGQLGFARPPKIALRLRFAGHFEDEHTGLFYNRFRDYDPRLGRYLQPDPIGIAGGENLYAYPANPLVCVDLRGLHPPPDRPEPGDKQAGNAMPKSEATLDARGSGQSLQRRFAKLGALKDQVAHGGYFGRKLWRKRVHDAVSVPHDRKHLKARTAEEAKTLSESGKKFAQFIPGAHSASLERTALMQGSIVRGEPSDPQSTMHVLYRSESIVGYDRGKPTRWIRAELTPPGEMHSHPRGIDLIRRDIPGAEP